MKLLWGLVAALVSGALLAISRDTGQYGGLVLIAPVPLLIYALRAPKPWPKALHLFGLACLTGVMGEAGPIYFYGQIIPMIYGLAVYQGLIFALSVLFLRGLYHRVSPAAAVIGFAAMTAAIEYLYSLVSPNGSFGALGYTMVDVLPVLQIASVAGMAGLSFVAAIIPAGLTVLIVKPRDVTALAAWGLPVAAALIFGVWRLSQPMGPSLKIALLSDDRHAGRAYHHPDANAEIAAGFSRQIAEVAAQKPAAIVIPEKIMAAATVLTPPSGSVMVAGLEGFAPKGGRLNIAALYDGQATRLYLKKRMVPGLEREYQRGQGELTTHIAGQTVGIAICKDMDFASDLRLYGQRDVALMLVPAWDFEGDRYLHGRMAVVRGVENGFAVARSASQGLMTLSDAHGRMVAEKRTMQGPSALVGDLPTGLGHTLYSRIGDVFAQGMVAVWLGLLGVVLVRRRKAVAP